jgi:hypothetical protein
MRRARRGHAGADASAAAAAIAADPLQRPSDAPFGEQCLGAAIAASPPRRAEFAAYCERVPRWL